MAAKPIKSLELHYTMIQFLIIGITRQQWSYFLYVTHFLGEEKKQRKYFAFLSLYDTYLIRLFQLEIVDGLAHGLKLTKEIFRKRILWKVILHN